MMLPSVLRRLLDDRTAFIAALLFAVHPALTEAVTYVFARSILWATLFSLLATRDWLDGRRGRAVPWFTLAMLGKEECVALPLVLALIDGTRERKLHWKPLAALLAVAILLGIRVLIATALVAGSNAGVQAGISPLAYLSTQGWVILNYLLRIVAPWGFAVDYQIATPAPLIALGSWLLIGTPILIPRLRDSRAGLFYLAGILLLLPSSSILPANDVMADRRMYLPMIAFTGCAALLFDQWVLRRSPRVGAAVGIAILLVFAAISMRSVRFWRSAEALWSEAVRVSPTKVRPRLQLARATLARDPQAALQTVVSAQGFARTPFDQAALDAEQGSILLRMNRPAEALNAFGQALALTPDDPGAINNRGAALLALGQREAARADFERALTKDRCYFDALLNLARIGAAPGLFGCRLTPEQERLLRPAPDQSQPDTDHWR
jgi:tetratricopeptide (TPR) repeat protein